MAYISNFITFELKLNSITYPLYIHFFNRRLHFKDLGVFVFFFISIIVLYGPGYQGMLIDDGVNAIQDLKQQGWQGLLTSYHFDSFYHVYYLVLFLLYKIFGLSPLGWFLFFGLCHSINAFLLFKLIRAITFSVIKRADLVALFSSLLFLWNPMAAENIVWAATAHYNISFMLLMGSSLLLIQNVVLHRSPSVWFYVLNLLALLSFELAFLFPFFFIALYFLLRKLGETNLPIIPFLLKAILPLFLFIVVYFVLLFFTKETLMPHAAQNTFYSMDASSILVKYIQNSLRLVLPTQFLPFKQREAAMLACNHIATALLIISAIISAILVAMYRKNQTAQWLFIFFLVSYLLFLAPFSTRALMYLFKYENIRYVYFASAFFYPILLLGAYFIHTRLLPWLFLVYSLGYFYLITQTVQDRRTSAIVYHRIVKDVPLPKKGEQLFLLNTPTYGSDWMLFWDLGRLPIALYCYRDLDTSIKIEQIISYNAISTKDSFEVKKVNDSCWNFRLLTNGSWLMRGSLGATSYSTNDYDCEVGEWGNVAIRFKQRLRSQQRLYYFDGRTYRELR